MSATSRFFSRPLFHYAIPVVAVVVAVVLRHALVRSVGELPTYITFYPAVMLSAILAGLGPGLLATLLAAMAADHWFIPPLGFGVATAADAVGLGLFCGMGTLMSAVAELYRRARQTAAGLEKELAVQEEHARAAEEIRQQKELLAVTLASIGDGVIVTDPQGRITFINAEAQRLTGWTKPEACGQPLTLVFKIIHEQTRQPVESPVDKVLRLGTTVGLANHTVLIAKDGREIPIEDSAAPIRQSGDMVRGVVLVFRDFTERNEAEKALARLAAIVESSDDAILSKDLGGKVNTWNAGAERLFGYKAEEIIDEPVTRLLPSEQFAEEERIQDRLRNGERVEHLETVRVAKDGRRIDVSLTASPVKDQTGRIIGTSKIIRDITERKRATQAVLRAKEEWERTFHSVPDLIAILDHKHRVVRVNRAMAQRLGREAEECVGMSCFQVVHGTECSPASCPHSQTVADGREHSAEVYEERLGGYFQVSTTPLFTPEGAVFGSVHVARDISERKRREEQLGRLNRTLKALSKSNQALMRVTDEAVYLQEVCRIVTEDCDYAMVWIGFAENDEGQIVRPVAYDGFEEGYLETIQVTSADTPRGRGPTGTAIRTGQACICRNMLTDPKFLPWREEAVKRGYTSSIALPLLSDGKAFGALTIYAREPDPFSDEEVQLLSELADDLACGINALRLREAQARAEEAVRRHREWLSVTLRSIGDAVLATDTSGRVTFLNPVAATLTGWPQDEALGKPVDCVFRTIHEETRQPAADVVAQVLREKKIVALANHTALVTKEGREVPIEDSAAPILDPSGEVAGVVLVFHDVTEKRRAQEALLAREERLRLLSEVSSELLISNQPQRIVESLCERAMEHLGCHVFFNYLVDEPTGRLHLNASNGVPEETVCQIEWLDFGAAVCGCVARDGCPIVAEYIQTKPDSRAELVRSLGIQAYACHPLVDQGRVIGTLSFGSRSKATFDEDELSLMRAVADHVSIAMQRMGLVKSLEKHAQQAEAANVAKSQFLASMSHELRTPMTSILGFTDLLLQSGNTEQERREYLQIVQENGHALLQLINDVLDLSKVEAGKVSVERVACSPWKVVEEVVSLMRVRAREKEIDLEVEYRYPLPENIQTDPVRLRQILVNLISNAIKFTERGSVRVSVSCPEGQEASPQIQFAVIDTGIGICAEAQKQLFQPFSQVDSSATRQHGGTGLGLAISKRLAELLGGDIRLTSQPGQGSTFTVCIDPGPLTGVQMLPDHPGSRVFAGEDAFQESLQGRILVVEDGRGNRHLVKTLLEKSGLTVDLAENGLVACQMVAQSAVSGNPYDVILMDIQMPVMDGYEATMRLRSVGWKAPILALTAHAMVGDRMKCLDAGCDDYLSKPISRQGMLSKIGFYLRLHRREPFPDGSRPAPASQAGLLDDPRVSPKDRNRLLIEFRKGLREPIQQLEQALRAENCRSLAQAAGHVAMTSAVFGFAELQTAARGVEELARDGTAFKAICGPASRLITLLKDTADGGC